MDSFLSFKILVDEVQIHQSLCMCPNGAALLSMSTRKW